MALTLTATTASAAADAAVDLLDGGSGNSTGDIDFRNAGGTSLCVCNLADPAFNAAASGVASAGTIAQGVVSTQGTISTAVFRNKSNSEVFRCTVSLSGGGGDIILTGTSVNVNDTIDITSLTYTQPLS